MTNVTYIVTPRDKKKAPFEVKTLKEAIAETADNKGTYKIKYTPVKGGL